jgi:hypothetical protein
VTHAAPQAVSIRDLGGGGGGGGGDGALVMTPILHLDAAKAPSYSGAGQTWSDISGANHHHFLGQTNAVEAADPVFIGTPGGNDGAAWFQMGTGRYFHGAADWLGESIRRLGRNDQPFTIEVWLYANATIGSTFFNVGPSMNLNLGHAGDNRLGCSPVSAGNPLATNPIPAGQWSQVAVACQPDGVTACGHYLNGAANGAFTQSTPWAAGDSVETLTWGPLPTGWRLGIIRVYDRILSAAEVLQNFEAQRWRYGL